MAERYLGHDVRSPRRRRRSRSSRTTRTSARSRSARTATAPSRAYWMHNGFVNFNGGKISEVRRVDEDPVRARVQAARVLIERHGGEALRCFLLHHAVPQPDRLRGRSSTATMRRTAPLRFPGLEEAERRLRVRLPDAAAAARAARRRQAGRRRAGRARGRGWLARAAEALDDDFNTAERARRAGTKRSRSPTACSTASSKRPRTSSGARSSGSPRDLAHRVATSSASREAEPARVARRAPRAPLRLLAIDAAQVEALIAKRNDARKQKDFAARRRDPRRAREARRRDHGHARAAPRWRVADASDAASALLSIRDPCAPCRRASR